MKILITSVVLVGLVLLFSACDVITPTEGEEGDYTCEGCHTDGPLLRDIIEDLDLVPEEGHSAPG